MPNVGNITPAFADVEPVMRDESRYGVPFAWGSLPLVYDGGLPAPPPTPGK